MLKKLWKSPDKYTVVSLFFLVWVAAFLRFYRLPDTYQFLGDQGRDALVVREMLLGQRLQLLGPTTSVGSYYLGPFYYYFIAPSLFLAGFDPLGPAFFQALLGVMTVLVGFALLKSKTNSATTLLGGLLLASSPPLVEYSRFAWNPNPLPLFTLLFIWCLNEFWQTKQTKYFLGALVITSILLQLHYVTISLLPVIFLTLFFTFKSEPKKSFTSLLTLGLLACVTVGLSVGPLLIGMFKNFQLAGSDTNSLSINPLAIIPNLPKIWVNTTSQLLAINENSYLAAGLAILILIGLGYLSFKSFTHKSKLMSLNLLTIFSLISFLIPLSALNITLETHYLLPLFSLFTLLISLSFFSLSHEGKLWRYISNGGLILIMILLATQNFPQLWATPSVSASTIRDISSQLLQHSNQQAFQLAVLSETNSDDPYVYFLRLAQAPVVREQDVAQQLFVVCEDELQCQPRGNAHWEIAKFESHYLNQKIIEQKFDAQPVVIRLSAE